MPQNETYQTNIYHLHGGNDLEVGSGGDVTIESGGTIAGMDHGAINVSAAADFFLDSETFFPDRLRNALMGKGAWSIKVGSTGGTISDNLNALAAVDSYPPITPSRIGYLVFSLANADTYSARLHSAYSGEELCIILRGEAGNTVSLILHFSADTSAANLSGVSVVGGTGLQLSSVLLYGSAVSRAFMRMIGVADGCWAIIDSGQSVGTGTSVREQTMV